MILAEILPPVAVAYLAWCWLLPHTYCRACEGRKGQGIGSTKWGWSRCRHCLGNQERHQRRAGQRPEAAGELQRVGQRQEPPRGDRLARPRPGQADRVLRGPAARVAAPARVVVTVKCPGLHCPGCGDGPGGFVLVVLVVAVIAAAVARPVIHAAEFVLKVALITAASVIGLAVVAGVALVAVRVRRSQAMNRQAITQHARRSAGALRASERRAIEAPRTVTGLVVSDEISERR